MELNEHSVVLVAGAGTMGTGIAQLAAQSGHKVFLFDNRNGAAQLAVDSIRADLKKLHEKGKISADQLKEGAERLHPIDTLKKATGVGLCIEAIIENEAVKRSLFSDLSEILGEEALLVSNTSSLSVTLLAAAYQAPHRFCGLHFFNPAPLMPLVELIPAVQTNPEYVEALFRLMKSWKKVPVVARDTPGFIVNRVARPFYGEALRIVEERLASVAEVDQAMKFFGAFKMGPFELMDLIGNDVNYAVTETVWRQMYFDQRYKPSLIQKALVDSGRLGRKSLQGYYSYPAEKDNQVDVSKHEFVFNRVLCMLMNEAIEALYLGVASREDIELAMTKGVNYPKGLLAWAEEKGLAWLLSELDELYALYREDRYRASALLRKRVASGYTTLT